METKFTEQEGLAIINEMIDRARNNIQKGNANSLIYNGYAVAFIAILNFILLHLLPEAERNWSFSVWWLMVPSIGIDIFLKKRDERLTDVKTQIDGIINALWDGFYISIVIVLAILFSMSVVYHNSLFGAVITPTIMIANALAEYGIAKACRFKPFLWGATGFWLGALLCGFFACLVPQRDDIQFLILALCMILGFVIPGYQLKKLAKGNV